MKLPRTHVTEEGRFATQLPRNLQVQPAYLQNKHDVATKTFTQHLQHRYLLRYKKPNKVTTKTTGR